MADIYEDARLYDALGAGHFGGSDRTYWHQQCARYGDPVLELACGSGRLTIPLAEAGVNIEGLDIRRDARPADARPQRPLPSR